MRRFRFHLSVDVEGEDVEEARTSLLVQNPNVGDCRIRGVEPLLSPGQRVTVTLNGLGLFGATYCGDVDIDVVRWKTPDGEPRESRFENGYMDHVSTTRDGYDVRTLLGVMRFKLDDGMVIHGYDVVRWEFEGGK